MKILQSEVFQRTLPVGMGYLPAGFAFGVLAIQAGLPPMLVLAMSIFIYAGALQFAAIPMLATAVELTTVALTTVLVNLRHVLYAIPLIDQLPRHRLKRAYVIAALTDETYSVLTTMPDVQRLSVGVSFINHFYWVMGTILGIGLGEHAARWIPNLDFSLPALFTVLGIEQYLARRDWVPMMVGVLSYFAATTWVPKYELLGALLLSLFTLLAIALYMPGKSVPPSKP